MRWLAIALLPPTALLLGGAVSPGSTPAELAALGWRKAEWGGIRPASFSATGTGGVRIEGTGQGSFIWRPASGPAACLTWRWRVEEGPPPTDLTRRGGDDRAVAIAVGFAGYGPGTPLATRAQLALAQAAAGDHRLPRSILMYVWGGTGQEAPPGRFFTSPWTAGISRIQILAPATTQAGWREERVNLAADWRSAFGGSDVPQLQEIMIATDADDTGSRVRAEIEGLRLVSCG
jgi:hypothetical protein